MFKLALRRLCRSNLLPVVLVAALLGALARPAGAGALVSESLAQLNRTTDRTGAFSFAVAGETRDALPYIQSPHFQEIIEDVNDRHPAFLALLGDMIRGYNITTARREWREFEAVMGSCRMPVLALPGCDDIWSEASRTSWQRELGPRYFSFDYRGAHFIFLDSEADRNIGITGAQLAWLRQDVALAQGAKATFVFMHRPLFLDPQTASYWEPIHWLLRKCHTKAVFAAHYHRFEMLAPRNGIGYYITGGGGAEFSETPELGGIHHWLLVSVEGGNCRVLLKRPGQQTASPTEFWQYDRRMIAAGRSRTQPVVSHLEIAGEPEFEGLVRITNQELSPLSGRVVIDTAGTGWTTERPMQMYEAASFDVTSVDFLLRAKDAAARWGPIPYYTVDYRNSLTGDIFKLTQPLPLMRKYGVVRARGPVTADGRLEEWRQAAPLQLMNLSGSEPRSEEDFSATVRLMWDAGKLYVALQVTDDVVTMPATGAEVEWDVDHARLLFDVGHRAGRRGGTHEFLVCRTAQGPRFYRLHDPTEGRQHKPGTGMKVGVSREGGTTTYEFIINETALAPQELTAGQTLGFNVLVGDDDGPHRPEKFSLLALVDDGPIAAFPWARVYLELKP